MQESEKNFGQVEEERWVTSASVGVLLRYGHFRNKLILVQRENEQWGVVAGRIEKGQVLVESFLQEVRQETGIEEARLFGWVKPGPQVVFITGEEKTKIGLIFSLVYVGPRLDPKGWKVNDPDRDIVYAKPFSPRELINLVEEQIIKKREVINRPEFNLHLIMQHLVSLTQGKERGYVEYVAKWLEEQHKEDIFPGLSPIPISSTEERTQWDYEHPFSLKIPGHPGYYGYKQRWELQTESD